MSFYAGSAFVLVVHLEMKSINFINLSYKIIFIYYQQQNKILYQQFGDMTTTHINGIHPYNANG